MAWSQKHSPATLDGVIGHSTVVGQLRAWAQGWQAGQREKPIILHGSPGAGKTCLALALAAEQGWDVLELNASDCRSAKAIERVAGAASLAPTFSGNLRLIIFDEVDGVFGSQDRGGATAIAAIIKEPRCPIILTANDLWSQKLSSIRRSCVPLEVKKVHFAVIARLLGRIAEVEKITVPKDILLEIAKLSEGDVRSAINDFEMLSHSGGAIAPEDVALLGKRDRTANILAAVRTVLGSCSFSESRGAIMNLDLEPDFILKWIEQNVPAEYDDLNERNAAFEALSKADIFLGRVSRRQNFEFWRYASDLMTAGVALAKDSPRNVIHCSFPGAIRLLSSEKGSRALRKGVSQKLSAQCHLSSGRAAQEYLVLFKELMRDRETATKLAAQFSFSEDELSYLGADDAGAVAEEAQKLANAKIIEELEA